MEVIGTPDFNHLDGWVNTFGNIVYVFSSVLPTVRMYLSDSTEWGARGLNVNTSGSSDVSPLTYFKKTISLLCMLTLFKPLFENYISLNNLTTRIEFRNWRGFAGRRWKVRVQPVTCDIERRSKVAQYLPEIHNTLYIFQSINSLLQIVTATVQRCLCYFANSFWKAVLFIVFYCSIIICLRC